MTGTQKPTTAPSSRVRRAAAALVTGGLALGLVLGGAAAASADVPPPPAPYVGAELGDLAPPHGLQEGNWNSTGS
ncbi:hypothetical protein HET69_37230 [Streptomyces sp. CJ_13]|uniref:hypothetical protein n=1 Tax=Streptomyces TaxID=1883 RepID=UPI000F3A9390|nr:MULTISPECIES: hypothetical protein [unclassified Streptomyces]AYV28221.1 hypothetical protein EES41_15980 [Streptomyces sp. ADI95-16]MBT1189478.1 hypothetical protein [Streptomyces sp. CJ_13]